jgi:cytochrome c oxidase subunit 3
MSTATETERVQPTVIGMTLFIASEIMFFGGLFAAYFSLRASEAQWPPEGAPAPALGTAAVFTGALIASSFTLHRAAHDPGRARRWVGITLALGAIFLAGQAWEWSKLMDDGLSISSNSYGTTFFTLTGAHGLHVIGGLGMLAITLTRLGSPGAEATRGGLEAVTYYWHFVDAVWLVVFTALYVAV